MQSESQSNRAPGPRGACREAPPARWNAAGFLPDGAEGNPASRRSRALHPQPKRLALSTPAASRTRLRAAHGHCDPPRDVLSNKVTNLGPSICRIKSAAKTKPTVQGRDPIRSPAPRTRGRFLCPRPPRDGAMRAAEYVAPLRKLKALPQRSQSPSGSSHSQQNRRPP